MMTFIEVPTVVGIIVLGIYKLFELFVRRKERLTIIEKVGDKLTPDILNGKIDFTANIPNISFSALKFGCLLVGLGLGLLVAFAIHYNFSGFIEDAFYKRDTVYGSCVLLFGGIGLLVAFLIELKINRKNRG